MEDVTPTLVFQKINLRGMNNKNFLKQNCFVSVVLLTSAKTTCQTWSSLLGYSIDYAQSPLSSLVCRAGEKLAKNWQKIGKKLAKNWRRFQCGWKKGTARSLGYIINRYQP